MLKIIIENKCTTRMHLIVHQLIMRWYNQTKAAERKIKKKQVTAEINTNVFQLFRCIFMHIFSVILTIDVK